MTEMAYLHLCWLTDEAVTLSEVGKRVNRASRVLDGPIVGGSSSGTSSSRGRGLHGCMLANETCAVLPPFTLSI